MSDLRPKPPEIELGGQKYGLLFDLNAIDEVQDKFDISLSQLADLIRDERKGFRALRFLLTVLINEAIDDTDSGEPHVDEKYVGRKISPADIPALRHKVFEAFAAGMPECDGGDPTQSE